MNETGSTQPTGRWPRWLKALLGIGVLILLIVGTVFFFGVAATARWERFAARLREQGQPLTFAEIEALRATVPEDRNGARVIERLSARLEEINTGDVDRAVLVFGGEDADYNFFTGIPRYTLEPSRAFRDRHADLLDELAALRDKPTGRFDIALSANPFEMLLPNLGPARNASKLLYLDSMLKLIDGEIGGCINDVALQCNLANTLHDEPILISRLVQIAINAMTFKEIENVLRVGEADETQLRFLERLVSRQLASGTMKWALWGERVLILEMYDRAAREGFVVSSFASSVGNAGALSDLEESVLPTWLIRNNQLCTAEMYGWLVEAANDPQSLIDAAKRIEIEVPKLGATHTWVKILMPSLTRAMQLHVKAIANLECARTALAAERFRLNTGRLPAVLSELVPDYLKAVPTDPFDGQPLRLAVKDSGIVIYSIAEDEVDDGGQLTRVEGRKGRPPDTGFRLLPLDQRGLRITDQPPPTHD